MRSAVLAAILLSLGACAELNQPAAVVPRPALDWRSVVTESDRTRLREWRTAFVDALRAARAAGHSPEITREAALLDPDAALGGGSIPNGEYRCRVIKLGAKSQGMLDYVSYPGFSCRITQAGQMQDFAKLTGSQRQVGTIFPSDPLRQVFLGTLVLADESRALQYGRDTERDVAGYVESIGPNRWRLIMPRPHFDSVMDVMELVPAS
jgi:hypothetical protein